MKTWLIRVVRCSCSPWRVHTKIHTDTDLRASNYDERIAFVSLAASCWCQLMISCHRSRSMVFTNWSLREFISYLSFWQFFASATGIGKAELLLVLSHAGAARLSAHPEGSFHVNSALGFASISKFYFYAPGWLFSVINETKFPTNFSSFTTRKQYKWW